MKRGISSSSAVLESEVKLGKRRTPFVKGEKEART